MKQEVYGFDLVDFEPDFTKTIKENLKAYREAYREVYGEYPPGPLTDKAP